MKKYLKARFYNPDLDLINDKTERFIVFMNDFKTALGGWYSILAVRIIPMLLFFVPINVVLARFNHFIQMNFTPDFYWDGPILMAMWALALITLLLFAIFLPKAASVFEFLFGFAYLFFVIRNHLYNTPLGILLFVCMVIFLLIKTFFLVINIMAKVKFAGDGANVERDESGRIVRSSEDDVFFVNSSEGEDIESNRPTASADEDFLFTKTTDSAEPPSDAKIATDDDFFFGGGENPNDERATPVAGTDDDFFFG